jgi:hypothetical protein
MTDDGKELTTSDSALGTPAYMSPEQITTPKLTDARSDVWGLGVLLHKLISGKLPFRSETRGGMLVCVCTKPPVPLEQDAPGVDAEVAALVASCLQKEPDERPRHAGVIADTLQEIRNRISATGSRPSLDAAPAPKPGPLDGLLTPPSPSAAKPAAMVPFAEPAIGLLEDERPRAPRSAPRPFDLSGPLEVDGPREEDAASIVTGSPAPFRSSAPPLRSSAPPAVVGIASSAPPRTSQRPSRSPDGSLRPSRAPYEEPDDDLRSEGEELLALALGSVAALVAVWVSWSLRKPTNLEFIAERSGALPHLLAGAALFFAVVQVARYDRSSMAAWVAAVGLGVLAVASAAAGLAIWGLGIGATLFGWLQGLVPWVGALSLGALAAVAGLRGKEQHEQDNTRMVVAFGGAALLAVLAAIRLLV